MYFYPVRKEEMNILIRGLLVKKSSGLDDKNLMLVKGVSECILETFVYIRLV